MYSDLHRACPFCQEDDAGQSAGLSGEAEAVGPGKAFRFILFSQVLVLLVMAWSLCFLLTDLVRQDEPAPEPPGSGYEVSGETAEPSHEEEPEPPVAEETLLPADENQDEVLPEEDASPAMPEEDSDASAAPPEENSEAPAVSPEDTADAPVSDDAVELKPGPARVVNAPEGVLVRSGPGTDHYPVASVYNGGYMEVLKPAGDGWYKVWYLTARSEEMTGYIMDRFLKNQ